MKYLIIACLSLILYSNCTSHSTSDEIVNRDVQKDRLHNNIKEDLEDGLSHPNTIVVDESNLPLKKWVAERGHSSIIFQSRHWEIVDLIGYFDEFEAVMYFDREDFSDAVIFAKANVNSIVMPNFNMAGSLRNENYFDAENFPLVEIRSQKLQPLGKGQYLLSADLKIKDIIKPIDIDVQFYGYAYPEEKRFAGFKASGKFSRFDFNIAGENRLHSGRLLHSETIYFEANLRMESVPE